MAASGDSKLKRNKTVCVVIPITTQTVFVFSRPVCLLPYAKPYLPLPCLQSAHIFQI